MTLRQKALTRRQRMDAAIDGPAVKVTKKTTVQKKPSGEVFAKGKSTVVRVPVSKRGKAIKVF